MTTTTFDVLDPVLVSDLPPVGETRRGPLARLGSRLAQRHAERSFERALRAAAPCEASDLIALSRR